MRKSDFFLLVHRRFHEFFAWLTHTGIQFLNGPWFSGIKSSSSRGFKNPGVEEISIPENRPIRKSYISNRYVFMPNLNKKSWTYSNLFLRFRIVHHFINLDVAIICSNVYFRGGMDSCFGTSFPIRLSLEVSKLKVNYNISCIFCLCKLMRRFVL